MSANGVLAPVWVVRWLFDTLSFELGSIGVVWFHTIGLYSVARRAQMPPLPTPRSSARWLAYGRADLEGIWNATMIIVSRGHLLAQDQTENRIGCYVLCLFRLLPSQA